MTKGFIPPLDSIALVCNVFVCCAGGGCSARHVRQPAKPLTNISFQGANEFSPMHARELRRSDGTALRRLYRRS